MYKKAHEYLSSYGIRPSLQRMAVMDYLMKNRTHPSADEIHSALSPGIPTLSRVTVYSTLSMLAARGAILALDLDGGRMHYDGDISPHAHFICSRCGKIHDIKLDRKLFDKLAAIPPSGLRTTGMQLSYRGFCEKCNSQLNDN